MEMSKIEKLVESSGAFIISTEINSSAETLTLSLSSPQDFGDYSESFYSVQTTEGETISQLIAGYIDIIMQKKRPIHGEVPDDEDEPVIVELEVDPQR